MSKFIEKIIFKFMKRNLKTQITIDIRRKVSCDVAFEKSEFFNRTDIIIKKDYGAKRIHIYYLYDSDIFEHCLKYEQLISKIYEEIKFKGVS